MKKFMILLIALYSFDETYSQKNYSRLHRDIFEEATLYYYDGDYETALSIFKELYPIDTTYNQINYMMGACMINIRSEEDSAYPYLEKAVMGNVREATFWLARSYHLKMDFDNAIKYYHIYMQQSEKEIPDNTVKHFLEISEYAKKIVGKPIEIELVNLGPGVNSKYPEYVPLISSDQTSLYFTSRRPDGIGGLKDEFNNYYEDIYYSQKMNNEWAPAINVGPELNTSTHDATVSLTSNGNEMIIYRTNKNLMGGDLYLSQHTKTGWSPPLKLSENINSKYQEASAIISPDGEIMYISSNKPGGYGGKDLYRARKLPNNQWSLPENLGPTINTPYNEDSPFIHADGKTLYFSSNGHNTIGGYDIFESKIGDDGFWSIPRNMGYPLNTVKDDIYFVMSPDGSTGYYSSNMDGGYGGQDIYKINILYEKNNVVIIKGITKDSETKEPLKSKITVTDNNGDESYYLSNSNTGKFILILQPDRDYKIKIEVEGYKELNKQFRVNNDTDKWLQEIDKTYELMSKPE